MVDEKAVIATWEVFAAKNNLVFTVSTKHKIRVLFSDYKLEINGQTIIYSRIARSGTFAQYCWTKVVVYNVDLGHGDFLIKKARFSIQWKRSPFKIKMNALLDMIGASEIQSSTGKITIKYNKILSSEAELTEAFNVRLNLMSFGQD